MYIISTDSYFLPHAVFGKKDIAWHKLHWKSSYVINLPNLLKEKVILSVRLNNCPGKQEMMTS